MNRKQRGAYTFPERTRFMMDGMVGYVRKAYFEMNTQMRLIQTYQGDEVVMLSTLQKEAEADDGFTVLS